MRCDPELFFKELISKSVSKDRDEAILEWEVVLFTENYHRFLDYNGNVVIKELGYYIKNPCCSKRNTEDRCKCVAHTTKRYEISKKTGKQIIEDCRFCNYRDLELDINKETSFTCICGEPIIYVFKIRNKLNDKSIPENEELSGVGSECIKKFLDCEEQIENANRNKWFEEYPNKFCPICFKKNRRKNLEKNEFKSCLDCPPLCEIMDCKNIAFRGSQLCKNHLGNFNLDDTVTLMPIDELPPAPKNILHYTKRSKAKVLKVPNKEY